MMHGADAAEQMVRLSLEGMEVAMRLSGAGAKNLAVILAAVLREEQKTQGKTRLTNLIKTGRELTVFTIPEEDLQVFKKEAKRYGVLYCDIKEKDFMDSGTVDIIARADDAPKINRIVEKFQLATVKTDEKRSTHPNADRTEGGPRSVKDSEYSRKTRTEQDFDERDRPSVREKIERMRENAALKKGRTQYGRER